MPPSRVKELFKPFTLPIVISVLLFPILGSGQTAQDRSQRRAPSSKTPSGGSMSLSRTAEDTSHYSMVVSDGEETAVTVTFSIDQLKLVHAIMNEAKAFALTEEGASREESTTTRFADPDESAFYVDVEKFGTQSSLYVTLISENGQMTMEAGVTSRSDKKETGPFFDILTRLGALVGKRSGTPGE
jgi:hypothetical protein